MHNLNLLKKKFFMNKNLILLRNTLKLLNI